MDVVTGNGKTSLSVGAHTTGKVGVPARYPCRNYCVGAVQGAGVFLLEWIKQRL